MYLVLLQKLEEVRHSFFSPEIPNLMGEEGWRHTNKQVFNVISALSRVLNCTNSRTLVNLIIPWCRESSYSRTEQKTVEKKKWFCTLTRLMNFDGHRKLQTKC